MAGPLNAWEPARRRRLVGGRTSGKANRSAEAEAAAWQLRAAHDLWIANAELSNAEFIVLSFISARQFYTRRSSVVDRLGLNEVDRERLAVSQ
jgi:hypothetical protein